MKNLWTTIMVKDMEESLAFYMDVLGLSIDKRYVSGSGAEIAFLGDGETKFELICSDTLAGISYTPFVSTGFQVDSVDDYMKYLEGKEVEIVEGPFEPSPMIKFFYIKDPNGYKIQLAELRG